MPIPIEPEEHPEPPLESCCFCDKPTKFWTVLKNREPGEQVACCQKCSRLRAQRDVPSKEEWCKTWREAHPSFVPHYN